MKAFTDRRHFIKTVIATSIAIGTGGLAACSDGHAKFSPVIDRNAFPQSVMSGDPTPSSVILWTRFPAQKAQDRLRLEVSTDANFDHLVAAEKITISSAFDYCAKVRIINLTPATYYYFRFIHVQGKQVISSPVGRTKTAPANDADQEVKFAYVSCQDYIGRYYNTYLKILEQDDLDFVVHLGDYIYETTGDASFQVISEERGISFDDTAGAVHVKTASSDYYGAASLDNYRQLYRTYRADPVLQAVQERFPFIVTWDDHEFTDDSWKSSGTYYNGRKSEADLQRKRNSEQVWLEYLPIDHEAAFNGSSVDDQETIAINDSYLYPNTKIYRDFKFGRHLHLFMTDYRTFRPDHIVPEDAYPGKIIIDEAGLTSYYAANSDDISNHTSLLTDYVDIDNALYDSVRPGLLQQLKKDYLAVLADYGFDAASTGTQDEAESRANNSLKGNVSITNLQALLATAKISGFIANSVSSSIFVSEGIGLSYEQLNKSSLFSEVGARYFITKEPFDLYTDYLYRFLPDTSTQDVLGSPQLNWLREAIADSTATHKVMGSSVSLAPFLMNLTVPALNDFQDLIPDSFKTTFYLNCDQWDGFPNFKQTLVKDILGEYGVISIAGDTHATFVAEHPVADSGKRSFDFTGPAVSSGTFSEFAKTVVKTVPKIAGMAALVPFLDTVVVQSSSDSDKSTMKYCNTKSQGVSIATVTAARFNVDFYTIPAGTDMEKTYVLSSLYEQPETLLNNLVKTTYYVENGVLGNS